MIISILSLIILLLIFYIWHSKRKQKQKLQQVAELHKEELQRTQLKVRESTLTYMAAEIHDHIGQLLAVVKLNLALQRDPKLNEARELISVIIKDMRELVHSMNGEKVRKQDLGESIENEVNRLRKSSNYSISFHLFGETFLLAPETQIGIFRIFQECITNIIKHSLAKNIAVELYFEAKLFTLVIRDDGQGFDNGSASFGLGLQNMEYRAKLLGASLEVDTSPGTGCAVALTIVPKQLFT